MLSKAVKIVFELVCFRMRQRQDAAAVWLSGKWPRRDGLGVWRFSTLPGQRPPLSCAAGCGAEGSLRSFVCVHQCESGLLYPVSDAVRKRKRRLVKPRRCLPVGDHAPSSRHRVHAYCFQKQCSPSSSLNHKSMFKPGDGRTAFSAAKKDASLIHNPSPDVHQIMHVHRRYPPTPC